VINVYWEDEEYTIICYDFHGDWTWLDLYQARDQVLLMLQTVAHRTDIILYLDNSGQLPDNILLHVKSIAENKQTHVGKIVAVTTDPFLETLHTIGSKFNQCIKDYFIMATSLAHAHAIIVDLRQKDVNIGVSGQSSPALNQSINPETP
jgi:hypothetical protein